MLSQTKAEPFPLLKAPAIGIAPKRSSQDDFTGGAPPVAILGIPFDNVTLHEAVERIQRMIATRKPHYVVTANVDFLALASRDAELRRSLLNAHLVLCDGTPLVWASRWLGNPLPERVAGADIVPQLIRVAAARGQRLFFLGATPDSNAEAVANVRRQYPNIIIAGHYSPPFRPMSEMDHADIIRRVHEARPDLMFVAFGCPKAEKWIAKHYRALEVPVVIGVGATIDFLAGRMKRAPRWMQRCGVEWLFRLCQEPRRLFRRYTNDLWYFAWGIMRQMNVLWLHDSNQNSQTDHPILGPYGDSPGWQWLQLPPHLNVQCVRKAADVWPQAEAKHCVLNMADVRSVDSTGAAVLLRLQRRIRANGKQLVIMSPDRSVQSTLRTLGLREFLVETESLNSADQSPPEVRPLTVDFRPEPGPVLKEGVS